MVSHRIAIFYLLDGLSKLTRIITYFQTGEHEKLITTFFSAYFPSPSVCHKNLRFYLKLLRTIIYSQELKKLIITFFQEKKWKNVNLLQLIYIEKYIDIHRYIVHLYIYISIYRTQYIDISVISTYCYNPYMFGENVMSWEMVR